MQCCFDSNVFFIWVLLDLLFYWCGNVAPEEILQFNSRHKHISMVIHSLLSFHLSWILLGSIPSLHPGKKQQYKPKNEDWSLPAFTRQWWVTPPTPHPPHTLGGTLACLVSQEHFCLLTNLTLPSGNVGFIWLLDVYRFEQVKFLQVTWSLNI